MYRRQHLRTTTVVEFRTSFPSIDYSVESEKLGYLLLLTSTNATINVNAQTDKHESFLYQNLLLGNRHKTLCVNPIALLKSFMTVPRAAPTNK